MHKARLLIIRRSRVRALPAPPAVLIAVVGEPWTGSYTKVGGRCIGPSGRIWSHRATLERLSARQGVRRNRPAHRPGDPVPQDMREQAGHADGASASCSLWPKPGGSPARRSPWPGCSISTCQHPQVRKVRGPLLDTLYARLMRAKTSRARRTIHRASQNPGSQARPSRTATGAFRRMSGSGESVGDRVHCRPLDQAR